MILMKDIVREGKQVLKDKAEEVKIPLSEEDKNTICEMMNYLYDSCDEETCAKYDLRPGVGLAAPQIGVSKRMFVMAAYDEKDHYFEMAIINPKIVSYSDELTYLPTGEGCLSVDREVKGYIHRPKKIKVTGYVYDFDKHEAFFKTIILKNYLAVVFGHEYDHLNGILFVDRINKQNPFYIPENSKPIKFREN